MNGATLDPAQIAECFELRDGRLFWRVRPASHFISPLVQAYWNRRHSGNPVRVLNDNKGYHLIRVNRKDFRLHRVIWALVHGAWPKNEIDHINGDPTDNRIENLRDVPRTLNRRNMARRSDNTSGVTGVTRQRSKWAAVICAGGRRHWLGLFNTFEEAVAARIEAQPRHGFTERHGSAA